MGFKGSNPLALVALTGTAYYLAGVGLTLAAIGEFILGNTYAMVVFMTFAGFWVSLAVILDPLHVSCSHRVRAHLAHFCSLRAWPRALLLMVEL